MRRELVAYAAFGAMALLAISCGPATQTTTDTGVVKEEKPITSTFRLLSINAMHALQDPKDVSRFAAWVKGTGAEVVAVQGIERATDSKPGFDAVTELSKKLDMRSFFGKARYYKGWDSGNALFSPYPIQQSSVFSLPVGKRKVRRSLTYGVVDMGLHQIGFCSAELDSETPAERVDQAKEICSIAATLKEYPIVVAADFGEPPTGKAAETMLGNFVPANTANGSSVNIEEHVYVVDHSKVKILSAEKVTSELVSATGMLVTLEIIQ